MRFTFNQVKYVLYNYYELSRGEFPAVRIAENLGIRVPHIEHARFEAACLLAGEVGIRVKKCGLDGLLVETVFMSPEGIKTESEVARQRGLEQSDLHRRINRVCNYCEGENVRVESYDEWRRNNQHRRFMRKVTILLPKT